MLPFATLTVPIVIQFENKSMDLRALQVFITSHFEYFNKTIARFFIGHKTEQMLDNKRIILRFPRSKTRQQIHKLVTTRNFS